MSDEPQPKPPTETARLDTEILDLARIVCAHTRTTGGKKLKLTDYLDSILRPVVTRDHAAVIAKITQDQSKKSRRPKGGDE